MKFSLFCYIRKDGKAYIAESENITIHNVLVKDDTIVDEFIRIHDFVVVVNKKGQLSVLCVA